MIFAYELIIGATRASEGGQKCKRSAKSSSTLPRPFLAAGQRLRRPLFFFLYRQHYGFSKRYRLKLDVYGTLVVFKVVDSVFFLEGRV